MYDFAKFQFKLIVNYRHASVQVTFKYLTCLSLRIYELKINQNKIIVSDYRDVIAMYIYTNFCVIMYNEWNM